MRVADEIQAAIALNNTLNECHCCYVESVAFVLHAAASIDNETNAEWDVLMFE
jgi:hypothetical protein